MIFQILNQQDSAFLPGSLHGLKVLKNRSLFRLALEFGRKLYRTEELAKESSWDHWLWQSQMVGPISSQQEDPGFI